MSDTVSRFSGRQGDYLAGRPSYPAELLEWLGALYAPPGRSAAADVGSGTGKLTAQLLRAGFRVYGVEPNGDMRRAADSSLVWLVSLPLGALAGEFIDLDRRMEQLGAWLKAKADRGGDSQFIQGFVTASLTVCIGAMAIVGSIQDGLTGDAATLYTKSILDFMIVMIFASIYGKGAIFSALPVGVLQGAVTLCAGLVAPVFSDGVIANLSFLGNMLIFCVGVNLCFGTKFKVANLLPALVFGPVFQWAVSFLPI